MTDGVAFRCEPSGVQSAMVSTSAGRCGGERDVSVVMACYTARRLPSIRAALRSLQQQSLPPRQVIVAVDNDEALTQTIGSEFDWATVVLNSAQRGASTTRNRGVAAVETPFVAFLDDDESAHPHWLAELMQPFHDDDVVGTGGKYEASWAGAKPSWFPDEFAWAVGGSYLGMPLETSRVRNVWSGNMAVRTAAFCTASGFRTDFGKQDFKSQPEDTDLCIRLSAQTGGHWMYVPSAVIEHEVPQSRASLKFFLTRCYSEGAGKALMRANLGSGAVIETEHAYVRRIVVGAVRRMVAADRREFSQALAMVAGVLFAGLGFVTTRVRLLIHNEQGIL